MKIKPITILTLAISLLVVCVTACTKPPITDPNLLGLHLSLGPNPASSNSISIIVEINARDVTGKVHVKLTLPEGVKLLSGNHEWDENSFSNGSAHKNIELSVQTSKLYEIRVRASGKSASRGNVAAEASLFLVSENHPLSPGEEGMSPYLFTVAVSPAPAVGQTIHVQLQALAIGDLPMTTLSSTLTDGLKLVGGKNEISQALLKGETLNLNSDILIQKAGEWNIHFDGITRLDQSNTLGNVTDIYVQAGTKLGYTITQSSMAEMDYREGTQYEVLPGTPISGTPEMTINPKKTSTP